MKSERPKTGEWVRVVAHYCDMDDRVGKVKEISDSPKDTMPFMVKFQHNGRLWPFKAEELELLGMDEPNVDNHGRLIPERKVQP